MDWVKLLEKISEGKNPDDDTQRTDISDLLLTTAISENSATQIFEALQTYMAEIPECLGTPKSEIDTIYSWLVSRIFDIYCSANIQFYSNLDRLARDKVKMARSFWNRDQPSFKLDLENTNLDVEQIRALSKLFLDRNSSAVQAVDGFNFLLERITKDKKTATIWANDTLFRTWIFWGYACEGATMQTHDPQYANSAIAKLVELSGQFNAEMDKANDEPPEEKENLERIRAELHHCLGHIYISLFLHCPDVDRSNAFNGVHHLEKAANLNSDYLSCYTSCFSELGEHDECIRVSKMHLDRAEKNKEDLGDRSTIILAEMRFYLANALLNTSKYKDAEENFKKFNGLLGDHERDAINHVELFRAKLELKRSPLSELRRNRAEIESLRKNVHSLDFVSHASTQIQSEKEKVDSALDFLENISGAFKASEMISQSQPNEMTKAVNTAASFLRILRDHHESDIAQNNKVLVSLPVNKLPALKNRKRLIQRLVEVQKDQALADNETESAAIILDFNKVPLPQKTNNARIFINQCLTDGAGNEPVLEISLSVMETVLSDENAGVSFCRFIIIIVAFYALKRFILRDQYVFALAPCLTSPALEFQSPKYSLADVI